MRDINRIQVFFELIDWKKLSERWGFKDKDILNHIPYVDVKKYWLENYDQRIGQVLINLNLIPDDFKIWIDEDQEILIDQGVEPREFLFWGSIYDKDMNLLEETKYKLIKDLDTDHIINILSMFEAPQHKVKLSPLYKETFEKELKSREK